jgi:hypothetical protein
MDRCMRCAWCTQITTNDYCLHHDGFAESCCLQLVDNYLHNAHQSLIRSSVCFLWRAFSCLQGVFVDGRREGEGLLKYVDGSRYQGSFKCNQFSGHGQMRYGALMEVSHRLNQYHTFSVQSQLAQPSVCFNQHQDNVDHAITRPESVTHMHAHLARMLARAQNGKEVKGRMYEGDWENGQYDGQGTLHLGNGDIYTGAFKVKLLINTTETHSKTHRRHTLSPHTVVHVYMMHDCTFESCRCLLHAVAHRSTATVCGRCALYIERHV